MTKEELDAHRSPMGFVTRTAIQRITLPDMKGAEDLEVVKGGKKQVTLGWTAPKDRALYTYVVEVRAMVAFKGSPIPDNFWIPHEEVEFERIDRLVKAKIKNLNPANHYEFRVITLDNNGKAAPPSEPILITTEPPDGLDVDLCRIWGGFVRGIWLGSTQDLSGSARRSLPVPICRKLIFASISGNCLANRSISLYEHARSTDKEGVLFQSTKCTGK